VRVLGEIYCKSDRAAIERLGKANSHTPPRSPPRLQYQCPISFERRPWEQARPQKLNRRLSFTEMAETLNCWAQTNAFGRAKTGTRERKDHIAFCLENPTCPLRRRELVVRPKKKARICMPEAGVRLAGKESHGPGGVSYIPTLGKRVLEFDSGYSYSW
jgi:hypothetical protein